MHNSLELCKLQTSVTENDFVGLKIKEGKPYLYLPLGYTQENLGCKDIDHLLTAIIRYAPKETRKEIINDDFRKLEEFPYFAYKWILTDYQNNGYYKNTESSIQKAYSGKINWKHTIHQNQPIMTSHGPIYEKWYTRKNTINEHHIIRKIHEVCVYESKKNIGWLFGNIQVEKPSLKIEESTKTKYLKILSQELDGTFDDQKKERLRNMIKILTGIDTSRRHQKEIACGTQNFYVVWEKMIDLAYGNIRNKEDYNPRGIWNLQDGTKKTSALRPDTIKIENEKAYIYDAKYYSYCLDRTSIKLPNTSSIQKQITYAEYLDNHEKFDGIHTIYNAFILPGNCEQIIEYLGYAESEWKKEEKTYNHIHTFLLDTKYLINHYQNMHEDRIKEFLENQ